MNYIGSKAKYAKHIIPHLIKYRTPGQFYVEPFVGGANILSEITGNRIGADTNKYLIAMWKAVALGWRPKKSYTMKDYDDVKANKDRDPVLTAYLGFTQSFGSKFLGTYARDLKACNASGQDRSVMAYLSSIKQFPKLNGVRFFCCDYKALKVPPKSIIYCDPPYAGTYDYEMPFDTAAFWKWAEVMSDQGHRVLVSEYEAPEGWEVLWNAHHNVNLGNSGIKKLERLFIKPKYK